MMKRVRLFHIKVSSGGRRKQQDPRQDGVNANGDIGGSDGSNENITKENLAKGKVKNGLLKTLRWKWRRSKRVKRVENHDRDEAHGTEESLASKKLRFKPAKPVSRSVICPVPCLAPSVHPRKTKELEVPREFPDDAAVSSSCNSTTPIPERFVSGNNDKSNYAENRGNAATKNVLKQSDFSADLVSSEQSNCASQSGTTSKNGDTDDTTSAELSSQCSSALVPSSSRLNPITECQEPPKVGSLTQELFKLSKCGWYWGPITRSEAEEKLLEQTDGAFLVRDSSDDRYLLSLSFRSFGRTLHTRIEHCNGLFSFYAQPELEGHTSIVKLIEQSMNYSQSGIFCYSRSRSPGSPSYPVRLTKPVSRFTQVRSLQYLCRFVIRQFTRFDHIQKLPLPSRIKGYLEEGHY